MENSNETIPMIEIPLKEYETLKNETERLGRLVAVLAQQLIVLRRMRFGRSSEKTEVGQNVGIQLDLFGNSAPAQMEKDDSEVVVVVKEHTRKPKRPVADRFPADLPVVEIPHGFDLFPTCGTCGEVMSIIGKEQVGPDMFDVIPMTVIRQRNVVAVWGCSHCEQEGASTPIIKAPAPVPVIDRGYLTGNTIGNIAVKKFLMGQPLYRQEQEWAWLDIGLSRQTMSNSLITACDNWLLPIYEEMKKRLKEHKVLHADETIMKVLHIKGRNRPVTGQYWQYRSSWDAPHAIIIYEFQPGRGQQYPAAFLKDWEGYLHTDGYKIYQNLSKAIIVVVCWAHLRRKFYDGYMSIAETARKGTLVEKGLNYCNALFMIEREIAHLTAQERLAARIKRSKPIVDEFFAWITSLNPSSDSPIYKAYTYAKNQQKFLRVFLQDGRLEISNNRAERSFRTLVITRKNYLFSNSKHGAEVNAVYYTLLQTAKENDMNPYEYLRGVFRDAPRGVPVDLLLPWPSARGDI